MRHIDTAHGVPKKTLPSARVVGQYAQEWIINEAEHRQKLQLVRDEQGAHAGLISKSPLRRRLADPRRPLGLRRALPGAATGGPADVANRAEQQRGVDPGGVARALPPRRRYVPDAPN